MLVCMVLSFILYKELSGERRKLMPYVSIHLFDGNVTVLHSVPGPVLCTRDRNESNKLCLPGIHP